MTGVAWSPDDKYLASWSEDKTVQIWDAVGGSKIFTYDFSDRILANTSGGDGIIKVIWAPDSKYLAIAYEQNTAKQMHIYNAPYQS